MLKVNKHIKFVAKNVNKFSKPSSVGMAVSQNTLLSNSKDVDESYDNSDDRDALAIGPNKDNSDSEENRCSCFYSKPNLSVQPYSTNDNFLVSDKVTPICDRPGDKIVVVVY